MEIQLRRKCERCKGEGELPQEKWTSYGFHKPCPDCNGTGYITEWVSMVELGELLGLGAVLESYKAELEAQMNEHIARKVKP